MDSSGTVLDARAPLPLAHELEIITNPKLGHELCAELARNHGLDASRFADADKEAMGSPNTHA